MDIPWGEIKSHVNVILCTRLRNLCRISLSPSSFITG